MTNPDAHPALRFSASQFLRPWFLVTVLCLIYCLAVISVKDNDPLALVTIGTKFSEGTSDLDAPEEDEFGDEIDYGTEGYDGQFVYYIARDPSNAEPYLDVPAYRFQRILLPALGIGLSFGNNNLIPWALLVVNLIALAGGTAIMESLLVQRGYSRWYSLGYALTLGVFGTVRLSLPEPIAYGLVLGGIVFADQDRWLLSAVLFAAAALAKETTLIFVAGYSLYLLIEGRWKEMFTFGVIVGAPFMIWQLILYDKFGAFGIGSGGALATSFEIIPFAGVLRIWTEGNIVAFIIFLALLGPFVLFPTLWGLRRVYQKLREKNYSPHTLLLLVNAGIMLFVPFSTYREPLGILRFIVGLQIAVILFAAEEKSGRALLNSTIWFMTLIILIGSDFSTGGSAS
jgi:hypothetical protein